MLLNGSLHVGTRKENKVKLKRTITNAAEEMMFICVPATSITSQNVYIAVTFCPTDVCKFAGNNVEIANVGGGALRRKETQSLVERSGVVVGRAIPYRVLEGGKKEGKTRKRE